MEKVVNWVSRATQLDPESAVLLLMTSKWDAEAAIEFCTTDREAALAAAGVIPPAGVPVLPAGQPCCVCFCDDAVSCLPCGHGLCEEDWPRFLKSALDNGTADGRTCIWLKCPGERCSLAVPRSRFQRYLTSAEWDRYANLLMLSFVNDGGNVGHCPKPGCDLYVVARRRKTSVTCKCGHQFCFDCGQMPHFPASCTEATKWLARMEEKKEDDVVIDTKNCPNPACGVPSFKVDGCHFIGCTRCKCHWCWMCGQWGGINGRPDPHHVFECTDEINQAWAEGFDDRAFWNAIKARFQSHMDSADAAAQALKEKGDALIAKLGGNAAQRASDAQLIQRAMEVLIECRRGVAWGWVRALGQGEEGRKLVKNQAAFENVIEQFNTMLSTDWLHIHVEDKGLDDLASSILEERVRQCRDMLKASATA